MLNAIACIIQCNIVVHDCGFPETLVNGTVLFNETTFGAFASYICDIGYNLNGNNSIECTFEGWSGKVPICES